MKRLWGEQEGHRGRHGQANTNIRLKELSVRKTLPEDLPETHVDWDSCSLDWAVRKTDVLWTFKSGVI